MTTSERTVPPLPASSSESALAQWASVVCDEPCDEDLVYVAFFDRGEYPCANMIRLRGLPRLPYGRDVASLERVVRDQANDVRARSVVLVWQREGETPLDDLAVATWSRGLDERLRRGPLSLRGQVRRTPGGFDPAPRLPGQVTASDLPEGFDVPGEGPQLIPMRNPYH
ncbi:hypothetical protein IFT77_00680 [Frigoribacterium sp. CFBP 13729]|jgi:hypothetical protein|uniref:hypothetical protein n=1 Tax=Frigoribacterium sp. CFBP 13729 TaxID=2775293 RepID=UPI00177EC626|nr:hypothetical protein [Frigoribacterium sp. CFBP 13729]MBD8609001.1 hypothetical protein [Frigoribacterium sp. CFBP 13729]